MTNNSTIEILDDRIHKEIQIDFNVARSASRKERLLPVVMSEFHTLMFHYPIVFVKDPDSGQFTCSVLLSINPEVNLLDAKAMTDDECLPLNILRLPLLAMTEPNGGRPLIAIDMAASGVGQGEYILKDKSANFEVAISALSELYEGYKETRSYIDKLLELDLISKIHAEIRHPGKPSQILEGLYGVDLDKVALISERDEASKNLFLEISSYAYAQNFSIANMKKFASSV